MLSIIAVPRVLDSGRRCPSLLFLATGILASLPFRLATEVAADAVQDVLPVRHPGLPFCWRWLLQDPLGPRLPVLGESSPDVVKAQAAAGGLLRCVLTDDPLLQ